MGFQDMPEVVHKAASAKGGRIKTKKGLAAMPDDKRYQIQSMGGITKRDNQSRKGAEQTQEHRGGDNTAVLADILGDINDI